MKTTNDNGRDAARNIPPVQRRHKVADLERTVWLRPRDIEEIYRISASTLHVLCAKSRDRFLPSTLIPGRNGRRGIRLVKRTDIDAYMESYRQKPPAE